MSTPAPGPDEASNDPRPVDPSTVAGILLVHGTPSWLPRTTSALAALDQPPLLVTVDDEAQTLGMGEAVARVEPTLDEHIEWLWLLHDDVEPRPDALTHLLRRAQGNPERDEPPADIVHPELLQPRRRNHPDLLAELGQSVGPAGQRLVGVEPGEIDQQQHTSAAVLGGSSAAMLVRRSTWRALGGMSPAAGSLRDGVELGWRANLAGFRVVTCPEAKVHHRGATRSERPELEDRLLGMRLVAAHSAHPGATTARLAVGSTASAAGLLLGKAPGAARDSLAAARQLLATGEQTRSLRQRVAAIEHPVDVAALRPGRGAMARHRLDQAAGWGADHLATSRAGQAETSIDELTSDAVVAEPRRRIPWTGLLLAAAVLLALVASRRLFGPGQLTGPGLAPAPRSLAGAWDAWLRAPQGLSGGNAPWLGLGALGSTLTLAHPGWFAVAAQLLAVPAACATALYLWRRRLSAVLWALAQPVLGLTGSGRASGLLLAVVLPLAVRALLRWQRGPDEGAERWRAPAAFTLWATICTCCLPVLWPVAVVAGVVVEWSHRRWARLLVLLATPVALAPWAPRLVAQPARLLTGSDPVLGPVERPWGASPWWLVLGVVLLLGAAAVLGMALRPRAGLALLCVAFTAKALVLPRLVFSVDGQPVRPDGQAFALLAWLCALAIADGGLRGSAAPATPGTPAARRVLTGLLAAAGVLGASWWLVGAGAPVHRSHSALPEHVQAVQDSSRRTRALMVSLDDGRASWSITADDQPRWGSGEAAIVPDPERRAVAEQLVASLAAGGSDQLADQARSLAVAHLWLRGADPGLVADISDSPGLGPAETADGATTWTVTGLVTRSADTQWTQPRAWWAAAVPTLVLLVLAVLAAPARKGQR